MRLQQELVDLCRNAVGCNECFKDGSTLKRSFIGIPHPRAIGENYWTSQCKILVLMINPGKGRDDAAHRQATERIRAFGSGANILGEIFQRQLDDLPNWGRFVPFFCDKLGLQVDDIALANVAWCSTVRDKYPAWMLDKCFKLHTERLVKLLNPDAILLSGSNIHRFVASLKRAAPSARIILAPHYAHREGREYEETQVKRIRTELEEAGNGAYPFPQECL
jgi:hypothetical protein